MGGLYVRVFALKEWVLGKPRESHWADGFRVAWPILESECIVYTCCLKTHRPLGVFTMALKLAVGAVPTIRHGFKWRWRTNSKDTAPLPPQSICTDSGRGAPRGGGAG